MQYLVECRDCNETVWVDLVRFGGGYIAGCPKCRKVAYNRATLPATQGKVGENLDSKE